MISADEQLAKAIDRGDLSAIRKWLDDGAALDGVADSPKRSGLLPLTRAAGIGIAPTRLLLERGANVDDMSDRYGALSAALDAELYDVVRLLLEKAEKPDAHAFHACRNAEAVQLLLDGGCEPEPFIKSALRIVRSRNDGDEELAHLAMVLRAVLPKTSKKRRGEIESALDSLDAWLNPDAQPKQDSKAPSLAVAATEAGQEAGEAALVDLDGGRPIAAQLADMADDAWQHDGTPALEMMFPDELDEAATLYTKAFIAAVKAQLPASKKAKPAKSKVTPKAKSKAKSTTPRKKPKAKRKTRR